MSKSADKEEFSKIVYLLKKNRSDTIHSTLVGKLAQDGTEITKIVKHTHTHNYRGKSLWVR